MQDAGTPAGPPAGSERGGGRATCSPRPAALRASVPCVSAPLARRLIGARASATRSTPRHRCSPAAGCDRRGRCRAAARRRAGTDRAAIVADPGRALDPDAARRFQDSRAGAREREPVAYILGRRASASSSCGRPARADPAAGDRAPGRGRADLAAGRARRATSARGSGAVALALKDERPDLGSPAPTSAPTRSRSRARTRSGSGSTSSFAAATCSPASSRRRRRLEPALRASRAELAARASRLRARAGAARPGRRARRRSGACSRPRRDGARVRRARASAPARRRAVAALFRAPAVPSSRRSRDLAGIERVVDRRRSCVTATELTPRVRGAASGRAGSRCSPPTRSTGSPATPRTRTAVERLYALKGRAAGQARGGDVLRARRARRAARARPAHARGARAAAARRRHAAGPQPGGRFPLACGATRRRSACACPRAALAGAQVAVLQSCANHAGGPDARRARRGAAGDPRRRRLVLDGGALPGTPSTVIDLRAYEETGRGGSCARALVAQSAPRSPTYRW